MVKLTGKASKFVVPKMFKDGVETDRMYAQLEVPFGDFRLLAKPYAYDEAKGRGEQRIQNDTHARSLKKALTKGAYTPTQLAVGLYDRHRKNMVLDPLTMEFELDVDTGKKDGPLPITDGGHRRKMMEDARQDLVDAIEVAEDSEKAALEAQLAALDALPVPFMLHISGDTKDDFLNLNKGRSVDKTHMLALTLRKGQAEPEMLLAKQVAEELNQAQGTFFKGLLRFSDTKAAVPGALVKKVAFNSLCQSGAADLSFSLVGLAKVGLLFKKGAPELAAHVVDTVKALCVDEEFKADAEYGDLTDDGKLLMPLDAGGSLGGATLYVGIATCLAYADGSIPGGATRETVVSLIGAALETLNEGADGDMSGGRKRKLMGAFARKFFGPPEKGGVGLKGTKVGGIPYGLLDAVGSAAAYNVDAERFKATRAAAKVAAKKGEAGEAEAGDDE